MKHRFRYIVGACAPRELVTLTDEDAHHLTRVVRRGVGDAVEVLDAHGDVWDATVAETGDTVRLRLGDAPRLAPRRPRIELAIGLADWGRLDMVVEKATEIGVRAITVFRSARAGRVPDASAFGKRRDRMNRVVESAMRQSGHAHGPGIEGIERFEDVIAGDRDLRVVVVDPRGDVSLLEAVHTAGSATVRLVIGPDAGLAEDEVAAARDAGCLLARLGESVLRAETAAVAAVSIAAEAGDWGRGTLRTGDDPAGR